MKDLIFHCENVIRSGAANEAVAILSKVKVSNIERRYRHRLTNLMRRVGLVSKSLKVISPLVKMGSVAELTTAETLEYSLSLQRIGSVDEAIERLKTIDSQSNSRVLFYLSLCYFNQWNYLDPIPLLEKYVVSAEISDYQKAVGELNLAAAYVNTRNYDKALVHIENVETFSEQSKASRIAANALELKAQIQILSGEYADGRQTIGLAKKLLKVDQTFDSLFLDKWIAVSEALCHRNTRSLDRIESAALQRGDSETLRDLHFFKLMIMANDESLNYLYFGTPYEHYRKRIQAEFGRVSVDQYEWGGPSNERVNLSSREYSNQTVLKEGGIPLRVLAALSQDFFKAQSVGALFSRIYPGEYFDITTSPNRVHQSIDYTKRFLSGAEIPLVIEHSPNVGYFLNVNNCSIVVGLNRNVMTPTSCRLHELKKRFSNLPFSREQAQALLSASQPTISRLLQGEIESGGLIKIGKGRSTRYQFIDTVAA